jgi:hypothetical protein
MQDTSTRSPCRKLSTASPVSTTVPTASWPSVRPGSQVGTSPLRMCRSVPQMVAVSIWTMASLGRSSLGSGLDSHSFWLGP